MEDKYYQKQFIIGLLEDELSTIKIEKKNYSIIPQFKMTKNYNIIDGHYIFMNQIREILIDNGIECGKVKRAKSITEYQTLDLYFSIQRNKRNIIKFKERIGFKLNKQKIESLEECYNILKNTLKPQINFNEIYRLNKLGYSHRNIAKTINISPSTVDRAVKNIKEDSFL